MSHNVYHFYVIFPLRHGYFFIYFLFFCKNTREMLHNRVLHFSVLLLITSLFQREKQEPRQGRWCCHQVMHEAHDSVTQRNFFDSLNNHFVFGNLLSTLRSVVASNFTSVNHFFFSNYKIEVNIEMSH